MTVADAQYSPRLRTAVVLCGSGTAGAYQAGALRALTEAGVKIDLLAGHSVGIMTALCAAIDGGSKLWDSAGPWSQSRLGRAYRWRAALRYAAAGFIAALLILASPLLVLAFAAAMYAASALVSLVNLPDASAAIVDLYRRSIEMLFTPPIIPTMVPRAVVLALLVVTGVLVFAALQAARTERSRRRLRGAFWWRLVGAPLDAEEPAATLIDALWRLVRGASNQPRPALSEIGKRYSELLVENFGQPGFREVLVAVHDLDARRDLIGVVLATGARARFEARHHAQGLREADIVDFAGPQRDLVVDFLLGGLRVPVASAPHLLQFPADSYWRGEQHRTCDRPELVVRLIVELAAMGVEQVIMVSPAAQPIGPHGLRSRPIDLRGRLGELVRSIETAVLHDAWAVAASRFSGVFVIRPEHNPIGPFDFGGVYDEASDQRRSLGELIDQGYEDAYQQFIEPVVASGERIEAI